MKTPTLWRYYGLWVLPLIVLCCLALVDILSRLLEIGRGGFPDLHKRIGLLLIGICILWRGLDLIILWNKYPSFLRKKAPKWDIRSRRTPAWVFLIVGIWFSLTGAIMTYIGARNTLSIVLDSFL